MLKAVQNWGVNKKLGGPDPRPPSGCALVAYSLISIRLSASVGHRPGSWHSSVSVELDRQSILSMFKCVSDTHCRANL